MIFSACAFAILAAENVGVRAICVDAHFEGNVVRETFETVLGFRIRS
jgi:hypothetical protein